MLDRSISAYSSQFTSLKPLWSFIYFRKANFMAVSLAKLPKSSVKYASVRPEGAELQTKSRTKSTNSSDG